MKISVSGKILDGNLGDAEAAAYQYATFCETAVEKSIRENFGSHFELDVSYDVMVNTTGCGPETNVDVNSQNDGDYETACNIQNHVKFLEQYLWDQFCSSFDWASLEDE